MDIKIKIKKLLALSESPNEEEAQSALLKAKEFMMKYKLTESDIPDADIKDKNIIQLYTQIECTRRTEFWRAQLAQVIADNYCCKSFLRHPKGKKSRKIFIIGYEDDAQICNNLIHYALNSIWSKFVEIRSEYNSNYGYTVSQCRPYTDSYALGFIRGLSDMYDQQKESHPEWGLVVVKSSEVTDFTKNLSTVSGSNNSSLDSEEYSKGVLDGFRFNPANKITDNLASIEA